MPVNYWWYRNLNFEIKMGCPHAHLGTTALCLYEVISYDITMILFMNACQIHVSNNIDSLSTLGIGLYLFYRKKVIAQFKTRKKR